MTVKMRLLLMWVFTGLLAALMLLSAVPDVLELPAAAAVFHRLGSHLAVGDPPGVWLPALIGLILISAAYGTARFASVCRPVAPQW